MLSLARHDDALWDEVAPGPLPEGSVIAAFEAWLLIRGLRTLFLRYERASANALAIARAFRTPSRRRRACSIPACPTTPATRIAARQMTGGFGGMLSILVRGGFDQARDVARFVQVFVPATSLGGVESLIEHRKAVEGPLSEVPENLLRALGRHRGRAAT